MKNKLVYILISCMFIFYNCKDNHVKPNVEKQKLITSDTIISNIKKDCDVNIEHNIYDYLLCTTWKELDEKSIKKILHYAKEGKYSEFRNTIEPETPSWINSDLKINGKSYELKINGMSYLYLIDKAENRKFLTFNSQETSKVESYFIRNLTEDDDENYNTKLNQLKGDLKNRQVDISKWLGTFTFDNNNYEQQYKKYTLSINNNKITFYQGELPGCEIYCSPYIFNNDLYLYYNAENTNCDGFDTELIDKLRDGDLILKLYNQKGNKFIQSPILNIWDDNTSSFKLDIPIKLK